MRLGLLRFLGLWLPPLAIFLVGLHRAWLTGQADPWDWSLPMALVMAVTGWAIPRRQAALAWGAAMGAVGMALLFCGIGSGRPPLLSPSAGLLAGAIMATAGGVLLRRAGRARAAGACALAAAALLLWLGPARPLQPLADRPVLAVVTALPIFWAEPGRGGMQRRDAPIVTVLQSRFTVEPLDDPAQLAKSGARRLLLAQPRALTAAQMVAVDAWVRGGGRALVLADPSLRWPSDLPLGDRRRPPPVSLLGPLLAHWGLTPSGAAVAGERRHFMPDGALVTLSGATLGEEGGATVRPIGRGSVTLMGDADMIDDPLWLADPGRPLDPRVWSADTPALVARWLGAAMPSPARWLRNAADVLAAIRWAVLAGTGWAMLGAWVLATRTGGKGGRTKTENTQMERQEIS